MIKITYNFLLKSLLLVALLLFQTGCEVDDKDLELATYSSDSNVFLDTFSSGLNYAAFGGSDTKAFEVDTETKYSGLASMRFAVPDYGAAAGAYAGGVFFANPARDLSSYDCLTFWGKASQAATIALIGFGNDLGANKYQVSISDLKMNTNWTKYYIPIPDPSLLEIEKGLLFYSAGPENERGYTFWLDEVKFEKAGTIGGARPNILEGKNVNYETFIGQTYTIDGLSESFSMPDGSTQSINLTTNYFKFESSNPEVATVNESGVVSILTAGSTTITAKVGDVQAQGALIVKSTGDFVLPSKPTNDTADVISIFSDVYTNVPVDFYNGYWEPYQTTTSADFSVGDDNVLAYNNFNFVGIQFTDPYINASQMSYLHMDLYVPSGTDAQSLKITIRNTGVDGNADTDIVRTLSNDELVAGQWNSIDLSLTGEVKSNLGVIIFEDGVGLTSFFLDNIYFYKQPTLVEPAQAAPTPTQDASAVISISSDAYSNVAVTTYRTDWSSATLEDVAIAGNNTMKYSSLDYVGIETTTPTVDASTMTYLHLDVWSADFTNFGVKLVDFGADGAYGGGDDVEYQINYPTPTQGEWISYDIPLSDFTDLTTQAHIAQCILVAQPSASATVFIDNIYFYKEQNLTAPTQAAPTPTREASKVISIFSDAYSNVAVTTYRTDWSSATLEDVAIAGNNTMKYSSLDYVGIETTTPTIDASAMTYLHVDVWSADFTNFGVKLVDFGADGAYDGGDDVEYQINYPTPTQGEWISYDIPLSDFSDLSTQAHIAQCILVAQPSGAATVFVDNFYFYKN